MVIVDVSWKNPEKLGVLMEKSDSNRYTVQKPW